MTITDLQATKDNKVMKLLGLKEVRHVIMHTNRGELTLMLNKDESAKDYRYVLDSVPLEYEQNDALKELLK